MDSCTLPDQLNISIPLEGTGSRNIIYKLPKTLSIPSDWNLRVAPVKISVPEGENMRGNEFAWQWQLVETDSGGNSLVTDYPPLKINGYTDDVPYLWKTIISMTPQVTIAKDANGMGTYRKQDVVISPADVYDVDETATDIILLNDSFGNAFTVANYFIRRVDTLEFVLVCSQKMKDVLGGVSELPLHPYGKIHIPKSSTRLDLLPLRHNICLSGLENAMVEDRLTPLLLSRSLGETTIEYNKLLYKRLHPQRYGGSFSSWDELEFYFEYEDGTKMTHDEGYMHLTLSLQWTQSGRMRYEEPLMRDYFGCTGATNYEPATKRTRWT